MQLERYSENLPVKLEDLARFVLIGREKLNAVKAGIRAIEKLDFAKEVMDQKKSEAQDLAGALLDAEVRIGQLFKALPKDKPGRKSELIDTAVDYIKPKMKTIQDLGFHQKQAERFETLAEHPKIVEQVKAEAIENDDLPTRTEVLNRIKVSKRTEEIQTHRQGLIKKAESVKVSDRWNVFHSDIGKWQAPRQYDFIVTDPPYPKEYLHLWEVLAKRASEWLKEGGLLIAMSGQSYLDEIYPMLCRHLNYYWTCAYLTPGQPTPLRQVNVNSTWKPLLVFSKGKYTGKIFGDVFRSDGNDKENHKWGQSVSGMKSIVSGICLSGQHILDPFCGAGTTGIAALSHGCFFDGVEIEIENVNISKGRLHDTAT